MENFIIKETKYTPEVNLNLNEGVMNIKGNSYPENTLEFYDPILNILENFFKNTVNKDIILNIEIVYFNSSSSRVFFEIFDLIEDFSHSLNFVINWICHNNDEVTKIGEDFKEDFEKLNFNIISKA
ncbi:DUF1987 domain-containing protein [Poseidonibacter antarcticus]|uniref:DUF1987 domain-containing protein n=1 Tax=Poseidonibacter antarcticus TaxID=2478538 RepID=UPI000EF50855|nr:DUF1987 domain-containing protein [Poseidonibacter antarcticus]